MESRKVSCYLAGAFAPWRKYPDWRDFVREKLEGEMEFYDPRFDTNQGSIATFVTQDLEGVEQSDCVFYFMASPRGDIGAAIECGHANANDKLVILCLERGIDFVHPFLIGISRRVLIGLDSGVEYLRALAKHGMQDEFKAAYEMLRAK